MTIEPALFLFDIDGTVLRGSTEVHRHAFRHAFETVYGLPLSLDGVPAAGRTDTWLLLEVLRRAGIEGEEARGRMPDAFVAMQDFTEEHLGDLREKVLPGVPEVLAGLHHAGQMLGLLTGNLSRIAMAKMRHARLAQYFDTGGFGQESEDRSHLVPVAIRHASEQAGHAISPDRAIVIGDTPFDIEAGQAHGTKTVGVATGPFDEDQLRVAGADLVLPSFADTRAALGALLRLASASGGGVSR
jgi:phosphoglycolate phosphatase